jgi:hypothetical protein
MISYNILGYHTVSQDIIQYLRISISWMMKAATMKKGAAMKNQIVQRLKQVTIYIRSITL